MADCQAVFNTLSVAMIRYDNNSEAEKGFSSSNVDQCQFLEWVEVVQFEENLVVNA